MLAYVLALAVGLGSLAIYLAAFFFPEIHRKNDFIWSGIGLFYALVLLIFAPIIMGGLLLGHVASVALLIWFGWQTLSLRRQLTPEVQRTPIPSLALVKLSIQEAVQKQISRLAFVHRLTELLTEIRNIFHDLKVLIEGVFTQIFRKKSPVTPPTSEKPVTADTIDATVPVLDKPDETKITVPQPLIPTAQVTETAEKPAEKPEIKPDVVVTTSIAPLSNPVPQKPQTEGTLSQSKEGSSTENPHVN
jgi:hypothetical protein